MQAQPSERTDSTFYQQSLTHTIRGYEQTVGVNSLLYKGKEYVEYPFRIQGDQYFQSYIWEKGSVHYEGLLYTDVSMKYDIANEVLIVDHAHLPFPVTLESARIDHFYLLDHHFIRLEADTLTHTGISTGFYDLLYDGKIRFLVKRAKILKDAIEDRQLHYWFEEADQYYIHKDNIFHRVKSKRSVLKVFYDHKKDIRKFLKRNKIKFSKQREEAIHRIVMYYDQQVY
jgi:hypothetical protein